MVGRVRLSAKQKQALKKFKNAAGDFVDVPDDVLDPILFGSSEDNQPKNILLREDPLQRLCREKTGGAKCLESDAINENNAGGTMDGGGRDTTDGTNPTGTDVEVTQENDIPRFIARLMNQLNSPEEPVTFGEVAAGKHAGSG